jgi:hypothetical protein
MQDHHHSLQDLVNSYFETRFHIGQSVRKKEKGALARLKRLEDEIFSIESESFDDLHRKATLVLHFLEDEDCHKQSAEMKEQMFKNVLHDFLYIYARRKLGSSDSPCPDQAAANYFNQMDSRRHKSN